MRSICIVLFLNLIFLHNPSFSRINDERIYDNVYNSCIEKPNKNFSPLETRTLCSCVSSEIMERFTVKELMELEMGILAAKNEETKIRIALSSEKMQKITIKCATEIYN